MRSKGIVQLTYRAARRVVVAVVGGTIVLVGVALLVLPGPAFVVLPLGLAVLAAEFAWARRWLRHLRDAAEYGYGQASTWMGRGRGRRDPSGAGAGGTGEPTGRERGTEGEP